MPFEGSTRGKNLEAMIAAEKAERIRKDKEAREAAIAARKAKEAQRQAGGGQFIQAEQTRPSLGDRARAQRRPR